MNALFTADWQVEWSNVDLCRKAWRFVVNACLEKKLKYIGVLGDMKAQYNPVDVRVTKFWLWAIRQAIDQHLRVFFVLGNHDRVGQYTDAQNWLPVLQAHGAQVYDKIGVFPTDDGSRIFVLPFMSSTAALKAGADALLERKPDKTKDVLVFHANLKNCQFNQLGQKSEGKLRAEDLHPDRYLACIGGDIHLPQKIGKNVYYTGSPFAMDWGEANQAKRFVVFRSSSGIEFLPSPIPGWFDPSWPNFDRSQVRAGARLRIHVQCSAKENYGRVLEKARAAAERQFPKALVYTVPEFVEQEKIKLKIKTTDSDKKKIQAYVAETHPEEPAQRLASMLSYYLGQVGGVSRSDGGIRFRYAKAKNFLSFKNVEVRYDKPGIIVVRGEHKDQPRRSNGAGKTSLLQLIPVALQGRTFKGQTHDKWARRFTKKAAFVKLGFDDSRDRRIVVERTRRPGSLHLHVDGVDQSSGLRSHSKEATQGMIEQLTGFTWQTLANAVYIDESVTRAFLGGTRRERTAVLSKFQNLERFEKALALVRQQKSKHLELVADLKTELAVCKATLTECRSGYVSALRSFQADSLKAKRQWKASIKLAERATRELKKYLQKADVRLAWCKTKAEKASDAVGELDKQLALLTGERQKLEGLLSDCKHAEDGSLCPTCQQPVNMGRLQEKIGIWNRLLRSVDLRIQQVQKARVQALNLAADAEGEYDQLQITMGRRKQAVAALDTQADDKGQQYRKLRQESEAKKSLQKYKARFRILRQRKTALVRCLRELEKTEQRLLYCEEAFSRDGIPQFLNQQLAPLLNQSAAYYAEMFGEGQIHVRFDVVDGEFEPVVLNATGGKTLDDQSVGEKALAGLITSFALREVAPPSNVLILDEPGAGLDEAYVRQFARALPKLKDRFGQVLVTSHNPILLAELANEHQLVVVKENKISRLCTKAKTDGVRE